MATSNMADHVGRVLGGRYRVLAPLGSGASARVYLAEDVALRRHVAVKLLHPTLAEDPAFLKRFRAEAQAAAALSHPHVVAVFDWGEEEVPYLVTEYLGGGTLRALLDRGRLLSPSQALLVGLEAARGLDYAHRRGFVHRDIKPANLLFDLDGRLRVADFGLARALAEAAWTEPAGVVLGTARYASPEQARGEAVDGRSDVYSLALVLIEAATGTVPFAADTTVATLMARLGALLRVPAELGPLAPVLERAGRPDPTERFTAGELARALIQAAERLPRPAPLPLVREQPVLGAAPPPTGGPGAPGAPGAAGAPPAERPVLGPDATAVAAPDAPAVAVPTVPAAGTVPNGVGPRSDDTTIGAPPGTGTRAGAVRPYDQEASPDAHPERRRRGRRNRRRDRRRRARRRWPWLLLLVVLLAAGGGAGAWLLLRDTTPTYALPDFTGAAQDEVTAHPLFAEGNLILDVTLRRQDGTVAGQVLEQRPPPEEEIDQGGIVHLVVSEGPTLALVPDLTGLAEADARAQLEAAGFVPGPASQVHHEEAPLGVVLDWGAKGTEQEKGTEIPLTVSAGPEPRTVPALTGLTREEAEAALGQLQLQAEVTEAFSDDVDRGRVISAEPGEGAAVPRDSVVALTVSKGPDLVTVPDVSGRRLDDAVAALRSAGLREGQVAGLAGRPVLGTEPRAGTQARRGSTVNLILG